MDLGRGTDGVNIGKGQVQANGGGGPDFFGLVSRTTSSTVDPGPGGSQVSFFGVNRRVTVNLGTGTARWKGGNLSFNDVHNVIGTRKADRFVGSPVADQIFGGKGRDTMSGLAGFDLLDGMGGRDRANGGPDPDVCIAEVATACELVRR